MSQKSVRSAWLTLLLVLAVVVAGCVPAATTPPAEGEEAAPPAGQRQLRFLTDSGDHATAANALMMSSFEERFPDYPVEMEFGPVEYADRIFAMAAAGNLPDVLLTADIYTAPFVDAGVLLDMQPFADADDEVNIDDVYESILGLGRVDGDSGLYMIPVSLDNVQVYYNIDLFESAGAPIPQADWTWDDMINSCKILQDGHDGVYCLGIGGAGGGGGFDWWAYVVPWIRGYGGDVLSADGSTSTLSTPESLAGIQAYADLWSVHEVAIPLGSDLGGNCFINQRCAVWLHIPIFVGIFRGGIEPGAFEWDVEVIPAHPEGRVTGMGTFGFAVTSGTQDPQAAWDFVKTLISYEGQETLARGYHAMPLIRSLAESDIFDELDPPPANYRAFVDGQAYGILPRTYPVECGSLYSGQVNLAIQNGLEQVIRGQGTAEQVFPAVDAEIQACLDRAAN